MRKNEPVAARRYAAPIPFYDLDGQLLKSGSFLTASGEVFVYKSSTNTFVAAANNATELGGVGASGQFGYQFTQAETDYDSILGVMLRCATADSGSITVTVTTGGGNAVYTRSAGSYLTDGFRVGHRVTWANLSNAGNNITLTITVLTALAMTCVLTTQVGEGPTAAADVSKVVFADQFWWVAVDNTQDVNVASVDDGALALAAFADDARQVLFGVDVLDLETGGTFSRTSIYLDPGSTSTLNDFYTGALCYVVSGTGVGGWATIDDYTISGGHHILAFVGAGLPVAPDEDSVVAIVRHSRYIPGDGVMDLIDGSSSTIEGSATLGDAIRLLLSVASGPVLDFRTGLLVFKSLDGSKTRVTGTTDASGRTGVTLGDLT